MATRIFLRVPLRLWAPAGLIWAFCLFTSASLNFAAAESRSDDVIVRSVEDFRRLCGAIVEGNDADIKTHVASALCLSYIKGIVDGYVGTLALRAEFDTAKAEAMNHPELVERFEADEELHDKITERMMNTHFLCFPKGESLTGIARKLVAHVDKRDLDLDKPNAYYVLVSGLLELYPCK